MLLVLPTVNILVFFEETPISLRPNVMEVAVENTDDMRMKEYVSLLKVEGIDLFQKLTVDFFHWNNCLR